MKIKVDFAAWLRTGNPGSANLGSNKLDVLDALSEPGGWAGADTPDEIPDFMDADLWGYGIWTLYFDGGALDAISCCIDALNEHGWWFDVGDLDSSILGDMDTFENFLAISAIPSRRLNERVLVLKNIETGELVSRRRRLVLKTILAGYDLQTRILFERSGGRVRGIGVPYSAEGQCLSHSRCCSKRFELE